MVKPWMKPISLVLTWAVLFPAFPVHLHGQDDLASPQQATMGGATVEQTIRGKGKVIWPVGRFYSPLKSLAEELWSGLKSRYEIIRAIRAGKLVVPSLVGVTYVSVAVAGVIFISRSGGGDEDSDIGMPPDFPDVPPSP